MKSVISQVASVAMLCQSKLCRSKINQRTAKTAQMRNAIGRYVPSPTLVRAFREVSLGMKQFSCDFQRRKETSRSYVRSRCELAKKGTAMDWDRIGGSWK